MPVYRPIGNQLVSKEEITERVYLGQTEAVTEAMGEPLSIREGELQPFEAIGMNKPLLMEIRHVYTGKYPGSWSRFSGRDNMLVTSAIRSLATFDASPKAVNFLSSEAGQYFNMRNPQVDKNGTPVMFYLPALTEPNNLVKVEMIFDRFDPRLTDAIGSAFTGAAGIPLFAAYSTHLLAAGAVTKLAGAIGERLLDGEPSFAVQEEISFRRAGASIPQEGFHLLVKSNFDPNSEGCEFDIERGRLIKDGKEYNGDYPYVVISLDGTEHTEYNSFVPTATSAALLEQFYHIKEGQEQPIDMLMEAVELYSDLQYQRKADAVAAQLENVAEDSQEYQDLLEKQKAYLANLITDTFKPEA